MNTRNAFHLTALVVLFLSSMLANAGNCITQSLAAYVKDGSCTINNREFAGFAAKGNSIDLDDVSVTPINNADYVGLEFSGFDKNKKLGVMSVQVSYTVSTQNKAVPFDELVSNVNGINFDQGTGVVQSIFVYTVAAGKGSLSLAAASALAKNKRAADVFTERPTDIAVDASMVFLPNPPNLQNPKAGPVFKTVRHRFSPPK